MTLKRNRLNTHAKINHALTKVANLLLLFLVASFIQLAPVGAISARTASTPLVAAANGSLSSTNWSGYAVNGTTGSVTMAQATWKVPAVNCPTTGTLYSSYWVGIDGFRSSTVEQTGTDSDCRSGVATYYAWYEFYPKASHSISGFTVRPGDIIGARVWFASGSFTVAIENFNTTQLYKTTSTVSGAARSSAEFIAEAPAICTLFRCKLSSLANFGTVKFGKDYTGIGTATNCALTLGGRTDVLGNFGKSVQSISMVSQSNSALVKAQPSALSADGSSFIIQWLNQGP
jgi:hypothetical protein